MVANLRVGEKVFFEKEMSNNQEQRDAKAVFFNSKSPSAQSCFQTATLPFCYPDLYAVIGDATLATLRVRASIEKSLELPYRFKVSNITVTGDINDLFDWDYEIALKGVSLAWVPNLGPMAQAGAKLQAAHLGKASSRKGGMVFQNTYVFEQSPVPGDIKF